MTEFWNKCYVTQFQDNWKNNNKKKPSPLVQMGQSLVQDLSEDTCQVKTVCKDVDLSSHRADQDIDET